MAYERVIYSTRHACRAAVKMFYGSRRCDYVNAPRGRYCLGNGVEGKWAVLSIGRETDGYIGREGVKEKIEREVNDGVDCEGK